MRKILVITSFAISLLFLVGCSKSRFALVGTWRAETTAVENQAFGGSRVFATVLNLSLSRTGEANYQHYVNSEKRDEAVGGWKRADDYLMILRENGGFVAFKITSLSKDRMVVVARDGGVFQFNRIQ